MKFRCSDNHSKTFINKGLDMAAHRLRKHSGHSWPGKDVLHPCSRAWEDQKWGPDMAGHSLRKHIGHSWPGIDVHHPCSLGNFWTPLLARKWELLEVHTTFRLEHNEAQVVPQKIGRLPTTNNRKQTWSTVKSASWRPSMVKDGCLKLLKKSCLPQIFEQLRLVGWSTAFSRPRFPASLADGHPSNKWKTSFCIQDTPPRDSPTPGSAGHSGL